MQDEHRYEGDNRRVNDIEEKSVVEKHYVTLVITIIAALLLWAGSQFSGTQVQMARLEEQLSAIGRGMEQLEETVKNDRFSASDMQHEIDLAMFHRENTAVLISNLDTRVKLLESKALEK